MKHSLNVIFKNFNNEVENHACRFLLLWMDGRVTTKRKILNIVAHSLFVSLSAYFCCSFGLNRKKRQKWNNILVAQFRKNTLVASYLISSCFIWACTYQQCKLHNMSNTHSWPLLLPLRGFFFCSLSLANVICAERYRGRALHPRHVNDKNFQIPSGKVCVLEKYGWLLVPSTKHLNLRSCV